MQKGWGCLSMAAFCRTFFSQDSPLSLHRPIPFPFRLLRTLLQSSKSQLFCFQAIPQSLCNTPGVGGSTPRADAYDPRSAHKKRVCRIRYLSGGCAWNVLLEPAGHSAKLSPGHGSVVSNCVGGCDG